MEMTGTERADLAKRVTAARLERFKGSRKAAYTKAELNSTTWGRVEAGETVKEHTIVAVVQMLWPETGGDWTKLDPPLGSTTSFEDQVRASNLSDATKAHILAQLAKPRKDNTA